MNLCSPVFPSVNQGSLEKHPFADSFNEMPMKGGMRGLQPTAWTANAIVTHLREYELCLLSEFSLLNF